MPAQIIVALDSHDEKILWSCVDALDPKRCALKIGSELFTALGPAVVRRCIAKGFRVFLDLKFHDIPNTVARAVRVSADLGVWMVNVHAAGGAKMLASAREALMAFGRERPLLIAVTLLTSQNHEDLHEVGIDLPLNEHVLRLARLSANEGLDGVVCSAFEVPDLKQTFGQSFLTVTPGLRLSQDAKHDQKRVLTPMEAQARGSDYLVIGRSITESLDPAQRLQQLYTELSHD